MSDQFSLSIRHLGDRSIVRCIGALDPLPAEKLREAVDSVTERGTKLLVVDCLGVTLLTSAGITVLVDSAIRCRQLQIPLEFQMSKHVRRVLDLVGLWWLGVIDDGISIHASLQRALRRFADQSFAGNPYIRPGSAGEGPEESIGDVELGA